MERVCSQCGSPGPFPKIGTICKVCDATRKAKWYQANKQQIADRQAAYQQEHPEKARKKPLPVPEKARKKQQRWRAANPERANRAVARWRNNHPDSYRERHHIYYLRRKWRETMAANEKLVQIVQAEIAQGREEGLDDEDLQWMATGAVLREARTEGVLDDKASPEFAAAAHSLVKIWRLPGRADSLRKK